LPPALTQVLMRCLAKRPADRWQTAEELLGQLEPLVTPSGGLTPTGAEPVPTVRHAQPWRAWTLGGVGVALLVALALVLARPKADALTLGKVTRITFEPGLQVDPAISPDGKFVVYAGGPLTTARIYARQAGGRPVRLTRDSGPPERRPLWSPDGTQILFDTDVGLFLMPALGGQPRLIALDAGWGAWSPDGNQVAFVRSPERFAITERLDSIFVTPLNGGPSRSIALVPNPHSLAWSPDGRWIALVNGNALFAGGVTHFGNKGPSAIVLVPAAGGEPVRVTDKTALNTSPVWSPDAHRLLFVSDRDGSRDVYVVGIGNSGAPTGKPLRLTTGLNAHSISLSADGTRLAYSVYTARANVWSIPIPTDGPVSVDRATQITTGNQSVEQASASPDGRWLYFDSDRSGKSTIYRMPLAGGEPQQLITNAGNDFAPAVSPDGRWVAFHSPRLGPRDIFVIPAEGGDPVRVTDDPGEKRNPVWSPDGRSLSYFLTETGARDGVYVVTMDQRGRWGPPRRVWDHQNQSQWSPDGRSIVVGWIDGIWVVPVAGGAARRLSLLPEPGIGREPVYAKWSRDGREIYFKAIDRDGRASLWAIGSTGGRPRPLVRFDDPTRPSYQMYWSTDGGHFYFTIDDRQSDIFVAELQGLK
jgi:Tol biopolymer transport system component